MNEVVDSTAVVLSDHPAPALFAGETPREVVVRMRETAQALKEIIETAHGSDGKPLVMQIAGRSGRYVRCEGWTTLGAMLSVFPVNVWTKPIDGGYEARVEARTMTGAVVGAAEAMCTREESRWKTADDFALRSMAQTRATSKALRMPLGFVMTLAGYDATPAEEMTFGPDPERSKWKAPAVPSPPCPEHGKAKVKYVPAGTSKKTGKPYAAFYVCDVKGCAAGPNGKGYFVDAEAWVAVHEAREVEQVDHDDLPSE